MYTVPIINAEKHILWVRTGRVEIIAEPHAASFHLPPLRQWLLGACAAAAGDA